MKLNIPFCPECGEPARGTVERLSGVATFDCEPTGRDQHVEYSSSTEIWWDEQKTVHQQVGSDNLPLVCCSGGHSWPTAIEWTSELVTHSNRKDKP